MTEQNSKIYKSVRYIAGSVIELVAVIILLLAVISGWMKTFFTRCADKTNECANWVAGEKE